MGALDANDVRHHFTPDVALREVAATALGVAVTPGAEPLEYEGLTDRYLPDQMLTGRTLRQRTQYAIHAAACLRGGLLPAAWSRKAPSSSGSRGRAFGRRVGSSSARAAGCRGSPAAVRRR